MWTVDRPLYCAIECVWRANRASTSPEVVEPPYAEAMCRNITELRGLEPHATSVEIEAAARQYVRKVSGLAKLSDATREPFERAVAEIAHITAHLLEDLPARRQPPTKLPPLRRPEVQARIAAAARAAG
jgi:hypothetical protein